MSEKLTPKQAQFVREYLIDLNATQAAVRAGYSEDTAYSIGQENLKKPEIIEALTKAMEERAERTAITADRVLKELAKIGFSDIRDIATYTAERVHFTPSDELDDKAAATVQSVKSKTRTTYDKDGNPETTVELEIKQHDKLSALEKIGKHLGMFIDRREVKEVDEFSSLTDADLDAEIKAEAAARGKATEA